MHARWSGKQTVESVFRPHAIDLCQVIHVQATSSES
jgi:hypothetical protein